MNKNITFQDIIYYLDNNFVLLLPTDTIYGLIADSYSRLTVENLRLIKGRPIEKTFAIFIHSNNIAQYCPDNDRNLKLFRKFTPGPVTFIIENRNEKLRHLEKDGKIGIRIPDSKPLLELLGYYKKPLIATSANLSGNSSTSIFEEIDSRILKNELVIWQGLQDIFKCESLGQASSIFDISKEEVRVVREGSLSINEINNFLSYHCGCDAE